MKILIIDDDPGLRKSLSLILTDAGYQVVSAEDGAKGLATAEAVRPDMIMCDIRMPKVDGLEFVQRYGEAGGEALVIIMTAYGSMDLAVDAMSKGAYDYLPKPFGANEVLLTLRKAEERESLRREVGRLRAEVRADRRFGEIIVRSPEMVKAIEVATKVAPHPSPVLITGASGTGKELVARLIHRESARADRPFVAVNCGAIPEMLLESEFFGYVKGAFTGADSEKQGLFEAADGGTLFLDEVGELPQPLQVKLLRALQDGEIRPVGGTVSTEVNVRIISATNRNLSALVKEGAFREDLYYRLAVVPIHLPPLKERREELPDLVHYFIERHSGRLGLEVKKVHPDAVDVLLNYSWPGNIRELENVLEQAMLLADGDELAADELPDQVRFSMAAGDDLELTADDLSVKKHSAALERKLIQRALERTGGNRTKAAELLELSARALRYKILDYGLD